MLPRRVAVWGAGRLFDSLVVHGGFDATHLAMLVDAHLKAHVGERHGCALSMPDELPSIKPGVVVVMSRGFAGEIAEHEELHPAPKWFSTAIFACAHKDGGECFELRKSPQRYRRDLAADIAEAAARRIAIASTHHAGSVIPVAPPR